MYEQFVHEFTDEQGNVRFAVGKWNSRNGQFFRPFDSTEQRLTGCFGEVSRSAKEMQSYSTRRQALRRARYLWSERS